MKRKIRLTEGDLHRIIRRCVNEAYGYTRGQLIAQRIEDGAYDDILDKITDYPEDYFGVHDDEDGDLIYDAVRDRELILNKDLAFKYGINPKAFNKGQVKYDKDYAEDRNMNIYDFNSDNEYQKEKDWDKYDKDRENILVKKRFPNWNKITNGGKDLYAKGWQSALEKDWYGTDQADSRRLHRKGSLNRAMDESKLHRIIKQNIRKALNEVY